MRLEPADRPGPALVLRLDLGQALRLDPERRLATELDAARLRSRSHTDASVAAGLMAGPGEGGSRTTRLTGSRTIAGHLCQGYRITTSALAIEVWVARDLPVRAGLFADFLEWSGFAQALTDLLAAIRALPGFPLETRMRLNVLGEVRETVSMVTAIRPMAVPPERFEVPPGWRVEKEVPLDREVPQ